MGILLYIVYPKPYSIYLRGKYMFRALGDGDWELGLGSIEFRASGISFALTRDEGSWLMDTIVFLMFYTQ